MSIEKRGKFEIGTCCIFIVTPHKALGRNRWVWIRSWCNNCHSCQLCILYYLWQKTITKKHSTAAKASPPYYLHPFTDSKKSNKPAKGTQLDLKKSIKCGLSNGNDALFADDFSVSYQPLQYFREHFFSVFA